MWALNSSGFRSALAIGKYLLQCYVISTLVLCNGSTTIQGGTLCALCFSCYVYTRAEEALLIVLAIFNKTDM